MDEVPFFAPLLPGRGDVLGDAYILKRSVSTVSIYAPIAALILVPTLHPRFGRYAS
jgi:hypothetical protein